MGREEAVEGWKTGNEDDDDYGYDTMHYGLLVFCFASLLFLLLFFLATLARDTFLPCFAGWLMK